MILGRMKTKHEVGKYNIITATGRKGTVPVVIPAGKIFVCEPFTATGAATHGAPSFKLKDGSRKLMVLANLVDTVEVLDDLYWRTETGWFYSGHCVKCEQTSSLCKCNNHNPIQSQLKMLFDENFKEPEQEQK